MKAILSRIEASLEWIATFTLIAWIVIASHAMSEQSQRIAQLESAVQRADRLAAHADSVAAHADSLAYQAIYYAAWRGRNADEQ